MTLPRAVVLSALILAVAAVAVAALLVFARGDDDRTTTVRVSDDCSYVPLRLRDTHC